MNREPTTFSSVLWKFRRGVLLYWALFFIFLFNGLTLLAQATIIVLALTSRWFIRDIERIENEHHE